MSTAVAGITIQDILSEVPVTDRTIRHWVNKGLLPTPVKKGLGRARGTVAYYPVGAIEKAKIIYNVRRAGATENLLRWVRYIGDAQLITQFERDGSISVTYRPKLFQEETENGLARV